MYEPEYNADMIQRDDMEYRQSTLGITFNGAGKFLLVNKQAYKDNEWSFPGGGIDGDETPEEALMRELEEELMVNKFEIIAKSANHKLYDWPDDVVQASIIKRGKYFRGQELTQFIVKFTGEPSEVTAGDGIRAVKWVNRDELKAYLIFPNQWKDVEAVIEEFGNLL